MDTCRTNDKKTTITPGADNFSSLANVLSIITNIFSLGQVIAPKLPPPLLLIGKNFRPGMSARNLAGRVISKLETDAGLPMGDVFADGFNTEAAKMKVISEETVRMIQTEAKVDIAIDPGAIQITSAGAAGPIPVVTQGANILPVFGAGGAM